MRIIKSFETWNNNIIDDSLFVSGRAKYDPEVYNGIIKYKTGNIEPFYFVELSKKGSKFICKIYKRKKDGSEIRLRNKLKKDLKSAHNYIREFLNQRLKNDKKKKGDGDDYEIRNKKSKIEPIETPILSPMQQLSSEYIEPPKSKTIIRRYH
jgi:hypothetical protein